MSAATPGVPAISYKERWLTYGEICKEFVHVRP